jgi:hypothetical protein
MRSAALVGFIAQVLLLAEEVAAWAPRCEAASSMVNTSMVNTSMVNTSAEQTGWPSNLRVYIISPPHLTELFEERFDLVHKQLMRLGVNDSKMRRVFTASARAHRRFDVCRDNSLQNVAVHPAEDRVTRKGLAYVSSNRGPGMPWKTANLLYNHVEAWNWVTLDGGPGLVLEDDVVFAGMLPAMLASALSTLHSCEPTWDILWPGWCGRVGGKVPNGPTVSTHLNKHSRTGCTHSYMISASGAERLLRHLPLPQCDAADHFMDSLFKKVRPGWKGFALKRSLIEQRTNKVTTHRYINEELVSWKASTEFKYTTSDILGNSTLVAEARVRAKIQVSARHGLALAHAHK